MEKASLTDKMLQLVLKRRYACCFNYIAENNELLYDGNFNKEIIFSYESDPIKSLLMSRDVSDAEKSVLSEYYSRFRGTVGTYAKPEYLEMLIHIKFDKDDEYIPVCIALNGECSEDGILIGYSGYIVSIYGAAAQIERDVCKAVKKAPFSVKDAVKIINTSEKSAVIQFDIRDFKNINQTYGEETGDKVLEYIEENLKNVWGREAVTCRLGADIFNIFTGYESKEELEMRIGFVSDKLKCYKNISYKFYFGVYLVTDISLPLRKMTDYAALARKNGRDNVFNYICYYTEQLSKMINNRQKIENEMENALETGQFKVYLQPKVRISDGKVIGAEALVRWIHPEKGLMPPNEFIPVFEKNGFIKKLDRYMHKQVCSLIRKWIDLGLEPVPVSANVSQAYLSASLPEEILEIIHEYNIPIDLFQIEITETYENRQVEICIEEFKKCGFTLLMDDFGSGYSSLNTLSNTRFDVIKLDRGFLGSYLLNDRCKKVVTHTIAMANDIGLGLVAEGVETEEQAVFLDGSGCKCAQGFLYSKPVPVSEFEIMVYGECITV